MIDISQVRIYPFDTGSLGGHTRAYADITIAGCLLVKGLRVVEGSGGGLFVAFPTQRGRDGRYHDLLVPLDAEGASRSRRSDVLTRTTSPCCRG